MNDTTFQEQELTRLQHDFAMYQHEVRSYGPHSIRAANYLALVVENIVGILGRAEVLKVEARISK